MLRFASRFCRIGIPFGLVVWKTQTIFNKQDQTQNNHFEHSTASSFMNDIDFARGLTQHEKQNQRAQQETENKEKDNQQIEHLAIENNNNQNNSETILEKDEKQGLVQNDNANKQSENSSGKDQNTLEVFEQKQNVLLPIIAAKQNNSAKVSKKTPSFLIQYLTMNNIKVVFDENLAEKEIKVINSEGDEKFFPSNKCLFELGNFLNPPKIVQSLKSLKALLKSLPNDEYIISTYIPVQSEYQGGQRPKSEFDTFSHLQQVDLNSLMTQFRQMKYNSASRKHCYVVVRDKQMARYLRINTNRIGDKYVLYKASPFNGMEASALFEGQKYTIKTVPLNAPSNKNLIHKGIHALINEINIDGDMEDFLRSLEVKKQNKKLMVIYSKQRRSQFLNPLKNVTLKVAKMMKDDVIVVMTNNQKLLSKYFQIIPDDFVTLRLLDTNQTQPSFFSLVGHNSSNRKFYSRKIMEGAFSVQNLCKFIKNGDKMKQYYERKNNLVSIPSVISQEEEVPNNTVILHWKHGCKGCQLTLSYLQQIQKILKNIDESTRLKYEIQVPQLMNKVQFRRFNVLNQSGTPNQQGHDVTPKVFMYSQGKMHDLKIGNIIGQLSEINFKNEEAIHESILKKILESIRNGLQK